MSIPFPGETVFGPSPRPTVIENPRAWILDSDHAYAQTQTMDEMSDGDVFIAGDVIGMLVSAWPVALFGDGSDAGLHRISEDADIRSLGATRWGRAFTINIHPKDGEPFPEYQYMPPKGGADYSASIALAMSLLS